MKKSKQKTFPGDVVFEVFTDGKCQDIKAISVKELKEELAKIWPGMSEFSLKAIAHLALTERLSIGDETLGIQWVGNMQFQPRPHAGTKSRKVGRKPVEEDNRPEPEITNQLHANDET